VSLPVTQTSQGICNELDADFQVFHHLSELLCQNDFDDVPVEHLPHLNFDSTLFAQTFPRARLDLTETFPQFPEWPESRRNFSFRFLEAVRSLFAVCSSSLPSSSSIEEIVVCVCHGVFMEWLLKHVFHDSNYGQDGYPVGF
jgi:broad specificity phosphatase PhoE